MKQTVLGIDVSKKTLQVALLVPESKPKQKCFDNQLKGHQKLIKWLAQQGAQSIHACLESTSTYGEAVAEALFEAGHVVSIVNPARIKGFALSELSRTKTDKVDAALIARFCLALNPSPWYPAPPEVRQLQTFVRRIEAIKGMVAQEKNRLETAPPQMSKLIKSHIKYLQKQIKTLEELIRRHRKQHARLAHQHDLLTSIPGIGDTTAAIILAEILDWKRFKSAKQFAAYVGLTPSECSSGSSVRGRPHLSRIGSSRLRKAFFLPAVVAKNHNPVIMAFCDRLLSRGKNKMQVIGAAMRKLAHLAYGVLKSDRPFDPHYSQAIA